MPDITPAATIGITTTSEYPGREIEKSLGVVMHVSVASASSTDRLSTTFAPSANLLSEALARCREGLIEEAAQRGADAVVAVHFAFEWLNPQSGNIVATSELAAVAYGTAVRLRAPYDVD